MIFRGQGSGFALPTVIITSVTMMIVLLASLSSLSSITVSIKAQYYEKLARTAAESGAAMAIGCLQGNDAVTWSTGSPLKPNTACDGTGTAGYIQTEPNLRTSFSVSPTSVTATEINFAISTKVELLRKSSGQVWKSYTSSTNAILKYAEFDIASGNSTTCATVGGELWCWGYNASGQVGTGATSSAEPVPKKVTLGAIGGKYVYGASTGLHHTCALAGTTSTPSVGDSKVYCWGGNTYGQMGNGTVSSSPQLLPIQSATSLATNVTNIRYTGISASNQTCVIGEYNSALSRAWCWGSNYGGQAADNTSNDPRSSPTNTTSAIPSNNSSAYSALRYNTSSTNSTTDSSSTSSVLDNIVDVAGASSDVSCGITTAYTMWCWGANFAGQLGVGTVTEGSVERHWRARLVGSSISDPLHTNYLFTAMSTNLAKVCAIGRASGTTVSGKIYCWGSNGGNSGADYRMSADITATEIGTPTPMVTSGAYTSATFSDIQVSDWGACAIRSDGANAGKVYCWGFNNYGTLGNNTQTSYKPVSGTPTPAADKPRSPNNMVQAQGGLTGKTVVKLAGGNDHYCAMTATGASYCWGRNYLGHLGDGTTTTRLAPVRTKVPFSYTLY